MEILETVLNRIGEVQPKDVFKLVDNPIINKYISLIDSGEKVVTHKVSYSKKFNSKPYETEDMALEIELRVSELASRKLVSTLTAILQQGLRIQIMTGAYSNNLISDTEFQKELTNIKSLLVKLIKINSTIDEETYGTPVTVTYEMFIREFNSYLNEVQ